MKTTNQEEIQTLNDMLNSSGFDAFQGDKLGNNLWIEDSDRAQRCAYAAADGSDGSTHAERLEDMREYLALIEVSDIIREDIESDIRKAEKFLESSGQLYDQVG